MPLERKILLAILISLITAFGIYGIYSTYYVDYMDKIKKTEKYRELINKSSQREVTVTNDELEKLEEINSSYRDLYFTKEESKSSYFAPIIKDKLEGYNLTIKQYSLTEESARYTISGKKWDLTNFLYDISRERKNYSFPIFNIRMINNSDFQGTIEITRPSTPLKRGSREIKEEIESLAYRAPYSNQTSFPLGTEFQELGDRKEDIEEVLVVTTKEPDETTKFSYVGRVKSEDETTLIFKENSNGRIFKFTPNRELSGWKYLREVSDGWIFLYSDKEYRVKR